MKLVAIALLAVASSAHAVQFQVGAGVADYSKLGDGMFYSQSFAHSTPTVAPAWRVAGVFDTLQPSGLIPGLRTNLAYTDFGRVNWSSANPQDAADFADHNGGYNVATRQCIDGNCGDMRRFNSVGRIRALSLTLEPYWNVGHGVTVGVEGGPALFRATWDSTAVAMSNGIWGPTGTAENLNHSPVVQLGALVGVTVSQGHFSARAEYLYAPAKGSGSKGIPQGIKGAFLTTVNYTW